MVIKMLKFFTIQNEGQEKFNNLLLVSSIKSFFEIGDNNGEFVFTQVKFTDGSQIRVKETVEELYHKLINDDVDAVGRLTIYLDEEGVVPKEVIDLFA